MGATYEIRAEEAASYPWVDFEGEVTAEGVLRAIDDRAFRDEEEALAWLAATGAGPA